MELRRARAQPARAPEPEVHRLPRGDDHTTRQSLVLRQRRMRTLVLLGAAAALAGCAHAPSVTPAQPSSATTGPCDPPEYVTQGPHNGEVTLDVEVDESGRALRVEETAATHLTDVEIDNARVAVKHAFHCRNPLPRNAPLTERSRDRFGMAVC